jgi:hypothetical protein
LPIPLDKVPIRLPARPSLLAGGNPARIPKKRCIAPHL